jgi:hypothetical protein
MRSGRRVSVDARVRITLNDRDAPRCFKGPGHLVRCCVRTHCALERLSVIWDDDGRIRPGQPRLVLLRLLFARPRLAEVPLTDLSLERFLPNLARRRRSPHRSPWWWHETHAPVPGMRSFIHEDNGGTHGHLPPV